MTQDPYTVLGVPKGATEADIRKAFRRLAKQNHPDLKPGDKTAEERFKAISAANEFLSDADKRARYDRGEIDADGNPLMPNFGSGGRRPGGGFSTGPEFDVFTDGGDINDVLAEMLGRGGRRRRTARGEDVHYALQIDFRMAAEGGETEITLADGKALKVRLPSNLVDGQTIRLRGKGARGAAGQPAGDALIEIQIRPDPVLSRDGFDIRMDLPIGLHEAVLGGRVPVPTLTGQVILTIPKGANSGAVLRLKGKGLKDPETGQRGDQYVRLAVTLPDPVDTDLATFLESWAADHAYDARRVADRLR
jgi:DnaJ-class molecular chaperone